MAIASIQKALDIEAFLFEGSYYLTKQMVADFYEVDTRTIENYLASNEEELKHNGYFLCKGNKLKKLEVTVWLRKNFRDQNNTIRSI